MTVLVAVGPGSSRWADELRSSFAGSPLGHSPDDSAVTVGTMRDVVDPDEVEFVVMWHLAADQLATYTNLRAILLVGAGFDHLDLDTLPNVPVVRLVDPAMASDIALYVLGWVIHFQREYDRFGAAQTTATWVDDPAVVFPRDFTVGVLGSGAIGTVVLGTCAAHGFVTLGWSRSKHDRSLPQFLEDCDVGVNVVPLSDASRHLVGAAELDALGDGVLINVGRGGTVDTTALIAALDNRLRAAVLDVFDTEPLPADSALWHRADVVITPHVAGRSDPVTAAPIIAASIGQLLAGTIPDATIARS